MAREIQIKEFDGVTKYRIWSTVIDEFITDWLTKEEMDAYAFWDELSEFMKRFITHSMDFPNMKMDHDTGKILRTKSPDEDWATDFFNKCYKQDNYQELIAQKFKELAKNAGITIEVKDSKGHYL